MKKLVETTRRINREGGGALTVWLLLISVAVVGLAVAIAQTVQTTVSQPVLLSTSRTLSLVRIQHPGPPDPSNTFIG